MTDAKHLLLKDHFTISINGPEVCLTYRLEIIVGITHVGVLVVERILIEG